MKMQSDKPGRLATVGVAAAAVLCCGLTLLLATGALSVVGAWFLDGGWRWVAVAPIAAAGIVMTRRRLRD